MKHLLFIILFVPILAYSQNITTKLSATKIGPLSCEFKKTTMEGDTVYYVICYYQNREYSTIVDIGAISAISKAELDQLISDLEKALPYMQLEEQNVDFTRDKYRLYIYKTSKLFVEDDKKKYTILSSKQVSTWIAYLKTIVFPVD